MKFPEVGNLTEANGGNKKFEFLKCVGKGIFSKKTPKLLLLRYFFKESHLLDYNTWVQ